MKPKNLRGAIDRRAVVAGALLAGSAAALAARSAMADTPADHRHCSTCSLYDARLGCTLMRAEAGEDHVCSDWTRMK